MGWPKPICDAVAFVFRAKPHPAKPASKTAITANRNVTVLIKISFPLFIALERKALSPNEIRLKM
jgi:hypothetical protein